MIVMSSRMDCMAFGKLRDCNDRCNCESRCCDKSHFFISTCVDWVLLLLENVVVVVVMAVFAVLG